MKHQKLGLGIAFGVALGFATASFAQQAVQWRVEDGGNGHWYQGVIDDGCTWTGARAAAISRGGDLVSLGSVDEADWVYATIASSPDLWRNRVGPRIGLIQDPFATEPSDGWGWSDQTPLKLTRWNPSGFYGQENPVDFGPCIDSDFGGYYGWPSAPMDSWGSYQDGHNSGCHWEDFRSFIIEWSADCNADGIVDYGQILDGTFEDSDRNGVPDCCDQGAGCQPNLLTNGGFEVGPNQPDCAWVVYGASASFVPGWSVVAVNVDRVRLNASCPPNTESWTSDQGEYTVDLDGSAAGGAISQTIATVPGREYALSFQLTGNGNSGQRPMRVEIGSSQWQFVHICQPTNPQPWSEKSVAFVAASDSTTIVLRSLMASGRNGPVIDAVRLVELIDPCPSDIDENGVTDAIDLAVILGRWGTNPKDYPRADANGDGIVDANDLAIVLSGWGNCP